MITVTSTISISQDEIEERFIRSPGPGGQKVNKVESAVQLRFDAASSPALARDVYERLARLAGRRMTRQGVIVITAKRFRSQDKNRADALARLIAMIAKAAIEPKRRKPTRPGAGARQRRLEAKRRRSALKKGRAQGEDPD